MFATTPTPRRFIALDLETTGLHPEADNILELAMVEVNPDTLEEVGDPFTSPIYAGPGALSRLAMNAYVRDMHTGTGLLARCTAGGAVGRSVVQRQALRWLSASPDVPIHVLGDSVHFDLAFLRVHMPSLHAEFHHRIVDTTSIWLGLGLNRPDAPAGLVAHRALDDARGSISKLKAFRAQVGKVTP